MKQQIITLSLIFTYASNKSNARVAVFKKDCYSYYYLTIYFKNGYPRINKY